MGIVVAGTCSPRYFFGKPIIARMSRGRKSHQYSTTSSQPTKGGCTPSTLGMLSILHLSCLTGCFQNGYTLSEALSSRVVHCISEGQFTAPRRKKRTYVMLTYITLGLKQAGGFGGSKPKSKPACRGRRLEKHLTPPKLIA